MKYPMNQSEGEFQLPEPVPTVGTLVQWCDWGTRHRGGMYAGDKRIVRLAWELAQQMDDGRPYMQFAQYTLSFYETSGLRKMLEQWRGRKFKDDEEFDPANTLGKSCLLNLTHSDDGKWCNVAAVMPLPKGMEPLKPVGDLILFSFDAPDWMDVYSRLPQGMQQKLAEAPEFSRDPSEARLRAQVADDVPLPAEKQPAKPMAADFDDDIPF